MAKLEALILPLGKVPQRLLTKLGKGVEEVYGNLLRCSIGRARGVPESAYRAKRGQFRSDLVLKFVRGLKGDADRVLGVTSVDLFVPALNFVFGQAECPGSAALISVHRLDPRFYGLRRNERLLLERAVKEAVHELGHTLGFIHCPNPSCVMSFSNHIGEVDRKSKLFCLRCFEVLKRLRV